jgi:hypothetical protein
LHAVVTLCPACRSLIERLRRNETVTAVVALRFNLKIWASCFQQFVAF